MDCGVFNSIQLMDDKIQIQISPFKGEIETEDIHNLDNSIQCHFGRMIKMCNFA